MLEQPGFLFILDKTLASKLLLCFSIYFLGHETKNTLSLGTHMQESVLGKSQVVCEIREFVLEVLSYSLKKHVLSCD